MGLPIQFQKFMLFANASTEALLETASKCTHLHLSRPISKLLDLAALGLLVGLDFHI